MHTLKPRNPHLCETEKFKADISDSGDKFIIRCFLAGYAKDEIEVVATKDKLTVTATKKTESKDETERYIHRESSGYSRSRTFYMGDIDWTKITADYTDGLLTLELPKTDHTPDNRKIEF